MLLTQEDADKTFLALVAWREAKNQIDECITAVGFSIMDRVKHPSWWGNNLRSVLFKRLQYSSMTFPRDPQLIVWPLTEDKSWIRCCIIASNLIDGLLVNPVPSADSYYDISIPAPKWAVQECFVRQIGKIRFYNVDRDIEIDEHTKHLFSAAPMNQ